MQKVEATKESGKENGRSARKPTAQTATEPSLQQLLGNRAIGRLALQRKMTVNAVGDKYEQEADAVAKEVVQKLNNPQPAQRQEVEEEDPQMAMAQRQITVMRQEAAPEEEEPLQMKPVQRQEATPEDEELQLQRQEDEEEQQAQRQEAASEEEEPLQMKAIQRQEATPEDEELQLQRQEAAPEEEEPLQMKAIHQSPNLPISQSPSPAKPVMTKPANLRGGGPVDDPIASRITQAQGGGSPLADDVRQPMEQAFAADFRHVRIHTNSEANDLNQSLQARAFTTGQDIFFRQGEYNPTNSSGQELLAHELTHVVQQSGQMQFKEEIQANSDILNESLYINHPINYVPQTSINDCWSVSLSMLFNKNISLAPGNTPINRDGTLPETSLPVFADWFNLTAINDVEMTVTAFASYIKRGPFILAGRIGPMIEQKNPNTQAVSFVAARHMVVIGGLYGEGAPETTKLVVYDPDEGNGRYEESFSSWAQRHQNQVEYLIHRG